MHAFPPFHRLRNTYPKALLYFFSITAAISVSIAVIYGWGAGLFLSLCAALLASISLISARPYNHIVVFFILIAIGDILKKMTFLWPDQALWSQYLPYLIPWIFYGLFIFLPWLVQSKRLYVSPLEKRVWIFLFLSALMTWANKDISVITKLAATLFILFPWTMLPIAANYKNALIPVCQATVIVGIFSALYGILQFSIGPTPIEFKWAASTADMSLGAGHLEYALNRSDNEFWFFWRITGFQPDSYTFAMFLMTSFAATWILRAQGHLSSILLYIISALFIIALSLSLVRTIWVSFLLFVLYAFATHHFRWLLRGRYILSIIAFIFFASILATALLHNDYIGFASNIENPLLSRAVTTGTLEARLSSFTQLYDAFTNNILYGLGYGAHPLFALKFSGASYLEDNIGAHNFIMELMWFTGVSGLVMFFVILNYVFNAGYRKSQQINSSKEESLTIAIVSAFLFGMLLSGLGNGGVFLNFYFFFFLGYLASNGHEKPSQITSASDLHRSAC